MERLARALMLLGCVAHAGAYLYAATVHVVDARWPGHARFHVLQALIWAVGFDVVLAILALGPLDGRRRWWTLLAGGLFVHGSYFAALIAFPAFGPPELSAHLILAAIAVAYFLGVGAPRSRLRPPRIVADDQLHRARLAHHRAPRRLAIGSRALTIDLEAHQASHRHLRPRLEHALEVLDRLVVRRLAGVSVALQVRLELRARFVKQPRRKLRVGDNRHSASSMRTIACPLPSSRRKSCPRDSSIAISPPGTCTRSTPRTTTLYAQGRPVIGARSGSPSRRTLQQYATEPKQG